MSKQFQIQMGRKDWYKTGINTLSGGMQLEVLSEPEPYRKENKSRWKIVNWWRKK